MLKFRHFFFKKIFFSSEENVEHQNGDMETNSLPISHSSPEALNEQNSTEPSQSSPIQPEPIKFSRTTRNQFQAEQKKEEEQ